MIPALDVVSVVKFIKMSKLNMFITAVCVLFLIKKLRWPKNKSLYPLRIKQNSRGKEYHISG